MKRPTLVATAFSLVLASNGAAAAETKVRFALDWAFQGIHGMFTLAEDNGHFAKEGLAVKIDRGYGSGDTISKIAAGTYDVGLADIPTLVAFNAKNPGNRVIGILVQYDKTETSIVALKKSGIKTPKDLAGRTIAGPAGTSARLLFPIFAATNGFDAQSVKWVTATPNVKDSLLLRGEADAVTAFPSTTLMFLKSQGVPPADAVVLRFADHGLDLLGNGIVVSEASAARNPEMLKAFVRASVKAFRDAVADPAKAVASARKHDNLLREDIELQRFAMLTQFSVLTPNVKANGFSHVTEERLARMIAFVAQASEIANPPNPREVFRSDFLPPASERKP
jgi:NitT/TauT family transport system substrate-binding protein